MSIETELNEVLAEVEDQDRLADTVPSISIGPRMLILEGGAQISSVTIQIDQFINAKKMQIERLNNLLSTAAMRRSALAIHHLKLLKTEADTEMIVLEKTKKDLLEGLRNISDAVQDL